MVERPHSRERELNAWPALLVHLRYAHAAGNKGAQGDELLDLLHRPAAAGRMESDQPGNDVTGLHGGEAANREKTI